MARKKCLICNSSFSGRRDARTCSMRCRKRLQLVRQSFVGAPPVVAAASVHKPVKTILAKKLSILLLGILSALAFAFGPNAPTTNAAASTYLNFQARLLTNTGAVVPDGTYNIDFKLYTADSTTGTVGSCSSACVWEEEWYDSNGVTAGNDNRVRVVNGYFSVSLGSLTSFSSTINWDQQLWLTMNIGGTTQTATPTWDGEMQSSGHSIQLTAVPLAFAANKLATGTGSSRGELKFASLGQATTITLPDPGAGTATVCYQNASACGFAASTGSTAYIQNGTSLQSNANFNIQSANTSYVGGVIRGASGQTADLLDLQHGASGTNVFSVGKDGEVLAQNKNDSTTAFRIQNASGNNYLLVNTSGASISVGDTGIASTVQIGNSTGNVTQTINVGSNTTGTTNINIGNSAAGTTAITGPTTVTNRTSGSSDTFVVSNSTSTGTIARFKDNTTTVASIADGGAALFQNSTDSTTAFQIQNQNAGSLLIADTSNMQISTGGNLNVGTTFGNRLFSDSFESGNLSLWNNTVSGLAASTTQAQNGKYSAAAVMAGTAKYARANINPSATVYGRMNAYVTSQTTGDANFFVFYTTNGDLVSLIRQTSTNLICIYNSQPAAQTCSAQTFPTTAWHKLEMRLTNGNPGTIQVWYDDNLLLNITNQNLTVNNYNRIEIGDVNAGRTSTYYMDNVSVDTAANGNSTSLNVSDSLHVSGSTTLGGQVLVQNGSDTSTAFQIQNAAGNTFFNVDTSGAIVSVGNAGIASTVQIGNTTGAVAQTINIGTNATGSSTNTVHIGDASTATDVVTIGSSNNVNNSVNIEAGNTGQLLIGNSTAAHTIKIGNGGTAAQAVTIGSTSSTSALILQGGVNGANETITLQTATSGVIGVGTNNNSATINVGSTTLSTGTQTIKIGNSNTAGGTTDVTIGTGATATGGATTIQSKGTLALGNAVSPTINIQGGSSGTITLGDNAVAKTITIGTTSTSAGAETIHIADTTSTGGAQTITIGGTGANNGSNTSTTVTAQAGQTSLALANGGATITTYTNSTTAFQVQNTSARSILTVDTSGSLLTVGNTTDGAQISLGAAGNVNSTIRKTMAVGGTVAANDVVVIDTAANGQVKTTTTASDPKVFGVATGSGASQDIVIGGVYQVNLLAANQAITQGDFLVTTTTAGKVDKSVSPAAGTVLGRALESKSGSSGGTIWVYVTPGTGGTGSGSTLTQTYAAGSTSADQTINLTSADGGGIIIKDYSAPTGDAFQLQNSGGASLLSINTANTNNNLASASLTNNLITNGSFETNTTGWALRGNAGVAFTQDSSQYYIGKKSLKVVTTANANDGVKYALTSTTLAINTKYTLSVAVRMDPGTSMSTLEIGHALDGTTPTDLNCLTAQTVKSTGWTNFSCTFTTGGTVTGTPYIYIKQTDATIRTFYIDAVQLTRYSILANASGEQVVSASDWQKKVGTETSVARDSTTFVDGANSVKIVTTGTLQHGVKQNISLNDSTTYTLSFYAENTGANAFTDMAAGYSSDGSTDTNCMSGQTVQGTSTATANWTKYTCTFVTPSSHSGTPYIYIKQAAATAHTFFVDAVQLTQGNPVSSYKEGLISLNGIVDSAMVFQNQTDSTTAFQIQNANGDSLFNVDSQNSNINLLGNNSSETSQWQTNSNSLNTGSRSAGSFSANGYAYVVGGWLSAAQSTVQYAKLNADGSTGAWATTTSLPVVNSGPGVTTANGYAYVVGGGDGVSTVYTASYFAKLNADGTIGTWNTTSSLPAGRGDLTSVVYNGYIYAIGGNNVSAQGTVYYAKLSADGSIGSWNTTTAFVSGRKQASTVIANGYLYEIGGENAGTGNGLNTVYYAKFNTDGTLGSWNTGNALPGTRGASSSAVVNGYIYVMGGFSSTDVSYYSTVFYAALNSDGSVGNWSTSIYPLPASREFGAPGIVANGYIYYLGGNIGGNGLTNVYYTSTSRVKIGGSLDLVGLSGENLNEGGTGGNLTAGNTQIIGTLQVQDQANFMQGVSINKTLTVNSSASFQNSSNSTAAFQVQNSGGSQLLNVDTTNSASSSLSANSVTNGSFEGANSTTGWAIDGASVTIAQSSLQQYVGNNSMLITTPATTLRGAKYNLTTTTLASNTKYTLTLSARTGVTTSATTSTMSTFDMGRADDGSTETTCLSGQTINSSGWTTLTCTFTTGTTSSTPYIFVRQSDATARTFFIDGVQLSRTSLLSNYSTEIAIAGNWAIKGSAAVTQDATQFYDGTKSLKIVTTTAAGDGAKQSITLNDSTTYTLNFYGISTGTAISTMEAGYSSDGTTDDTICITGQTIANSIWTNYSCTFTTPATHSGTPFIYIKSTGTVVRTFFLDSIVLSTGSTLSSYREGTIALNGIINSPTVFQNQSDSSTEFQIQNATGGSLLLIDSLNSNITINGNNSGMVQPWITGNSTGIAGRDNFASVISNGYMYLIGGISSGTAQTTVQYAKINANGNVGNWSTTTALTAARAAPSAAVYNGYVYVTGGSSANSNATATDTTFYAKINSDGTLGSWTQAPNAIPTKVWDHTSAAYNGYLYEVNGINTAGSSVSTTYYAKINADGSIGAWTAGTTTTSSVADHSTVVANGYIYALGGSGGTITQYARIGADGSLGAWAATTNIPTASRTGAGTAVANGYVYLIGGSNNSGTYYASTLYAPLNSDGTIGAWSCQGTASECAGATQVNATALPATRGWFGTTGLVSNGRLYVVGGVNAGGGGNTTVYYTSTARVQLNGALDLVGTSGENLNEGGTGGELTAGNTNIIGNLGVTGSATVQKGLYVGDNLTVGGTASFINGSNSTNAFQVQNTAGTATALGINTTITPNLIYNSDFESNTNGWTGLTGGDTLSTTNTAAALVKGSQAMLDTTTATANRGIKFAYQFKASTQYTFSIYAGVSTGSTGAFFQLGRIENSVTITTSCPTTQTLTTTMTRYTCTFTTGATIVNGDGVIARYTDATNAYNLYFDAAQLEQGSTATNYSSQTASLYVNTATNNVVIGGNNSGALQAWQTNPNAVGAALVGSSSVTANGYAYVIGGTTTTSTAQAVNTVYYAKLKPDGSTGAWATTTALGSGSTNKRVYHTSVVSNGYIYTIGGIDETPTYKNTTLYAKINSDGTVGTWNTTTVIPLAIAQLSSVTANGYIYVSGGDTGVATQAAVYYGKVNADGTISSWTTAANPIPKTRDFHTSVVANGYIYVIGGHDRATTNYFDTTFYAPLNSSDGSIGTWNCEGTSGATSCSGATIANANSLPGVRGTHTSVVANGYVYVIGGTNASTTQSTVYFARLNSDGTTGAWSTDSTTLPEIRRLMASVIYNGYIYVFDGYNGTANQSSVWYTSTQRILVGGSLDLVGLSAQSTDAGDTSLGSAGGSLTAGNTNIVGNFQVQGQALFAQGVAVNGNFTANGSALFQNATNSTTAFQIQNAAGTTTVFDADTTNGRVGIGTTTTTNAVLTVNGAVPDVFLGAGITANATSTSTTNGANGIEGNITATPGSSATGTFVGVAGLAQSTSANVAANARLAGVQGYVSYGGTGTLYKSYAGLFGGEVDDTATVSNFNGIEVDHPTKVVGATITNNVGIDIRALTEGTNNTYLLIGQDTANAGNFGIYEASTYANYLAGATTIAVDGTTALQVQNAAANVNYFSVDTTNKKVIVGTSDTSGTLLILDTDTDATIKAGVGTNAATEVDGAMFYSSTSRSFVCGQNGAWLSCLGGLRSSQTAASNAITAASDTNFSGGTGISYTIPANDCVVGRVYRVTAYGRYTVATAARRVDFKVKFGSTVLATTATTANNTGILTNAQWSVKVDITCISTGGSGTVEAQGTAITASTVNDSFVTQMVNSAAVTVDTTTTQTLQLSAGWDATTNAPTLTMRSLVIEGIGP